MVNDAFAPNTIYKLYLLSFQVMVCNLSIAWRDFYITYLINNFVYEKNFYPLSLSSYFLQHISS